MQDRFELFSLAVSRLYKFLQKIKAMEMTEFGLKGAHTMCLYYLGKYPEGLTVSELSSHCCEDKAAVSRAVNELGSLGFIHTESGKSKREYREKLFLTEKGEMTAESIKAKVAHALDIGGAGLSDEQRDNLYTSLNIIAKNLENYSDFK